MLELTKLKLDGWLSYDTAVLKLNSPGVTLIHGKIGSGKSAIFEAIFYLLFGKTLRDKDSVNSLVNKLLGNGYDISLELQIDGIEYRIQEIRGRPGKGLAFFKAGKTRVGASDNETRKIIQEELGISPSEFRSIAFFGQKQSHTLLEGTPGERATALVDIFGLDKYDAAVKRCADLIKQGNIKGQELTKEAENVDKEVENLEELLENNYNIDENAVKAKQEKLEKVSEFIQIVEKKLEKLAKIAEKSRSKVQKATILAKQAERTTTLEAELAKLRSTLMNNDWPDAPADELEEALEELRQTRARYSSILIGNKNELEKVEKNENVCPVNQAACPVNIPQNFRKKTIETCKDNMSKADKEIVKIDKDTEETKNSLKRAKKREEITFEVQTKASLLKQLGHEEPPNVKEEEEHIEKAEQAIEKGNIKLREHKDLQNSLRVDITVYEKTKVLEKNVKNSIAKNEENRAKIQGKVAENSLELRYLAAALSIIKKAKMYRIDMVLQLLNQYVNEILDEISYSVYKAQFVSQQSDATGSRLLDKIGILVSDPYKTIPIELCSGGQSTEVGLAVLLGTWKAAYALSTKAVSSMWLDEVFGSLDQETVDRVFQSVVNVAQELGTHSIKIVSHRELDPRLFNNIWHIEMENGLSEIRLE
jgi:exonuclease SbcC